MSKLVAEEYLSSLTDLTVNSKPLINMLTMLADENVDHAPAIVQVIENHLEKVPPEVKLPILYLIDSIIKNVSKVYVPLFTQNIVNVFVSVFEKVDERTRLNMYKLRQTWADVFPARKLYVLDLRVKDIDHAWPVTAPTPTSIHFNPKFLGNKTGVAEVSPGTPSPPQVTTPVVTTASSQTSQVTEAVLREQLPEKQKILIELQQKKLELQLMQTKALMEGQENRLNDTGEHSLITNLVRPPNTEEAVKLFSRRAAVKPKAVVTPPVNVAPTKSVPNSAVRPPLNEKGPKLFSRRGVAKSKASGTSSTNSSVKLDSPNIVQNKSKMTQANDGVKSRDPRIARKQQQQQQNKNSTSKSEPTKKKSTPANAKTSQTTKSRPSKAAKQKQQNKIPEVTQKEQEIYNRQLAMLKPPLAEQVAPVVPVSKDLENLVNVSGKDVDLRLLNVRSESPSKKRLSPEVQVDEPPKKKNKSEIFDEIPSLRNPKPEKPLFPINVLSYVNTIIAQAADQVRNGTMSLHEYNEVLKQVIHVNEKQKLREAQNKSRQEIRRNQHPHKNRRSPNRLGSKNRDSPTFRHDDDMRDRLPYNDIDERLQMPWSNRLPNDSAPGFNRLNDSCGPPRMPFDISEYNKRPKPNVWEEDNSIQKTDESSESRSLTKSSYVKYDVSSRDLIINFSLKLHFDIGLRHQFRRSGIVSKARDMKCNERTHDCVDVPPADPQILELIAKDPMKSINIDRTARDIRFYGDTAVVMLSYDDPKEISFEDGIRRVAIGDISIVCALNDPYIMFMLNGTPHRIRLGAPTRELYIDGEFYEAHFGGPPVQVQIDGLPYVVQLEGPPPQVKIGKKRTDLICGRVNMIVDATEILPLFLDAKPQRFDLRSRPYVFRFVNGLKTLLVNEVPLDIQFNGGCRQICGYGNLHFIRLSMLPNGIEPGHVQIVNMENSNPSISSVLETSVPIGSHSPSSNNIQQPNITAEVNPVAPCYDISQPVPATSVPTGGGPLDILTSLMSGMSAPLQSAGFNYQVEKTEQQPFTQPSAAPSDAETPASRPASSSVNILGSGLNINDLFQRLVASGIVPTLSNSSTNSQKSQNESSIKPVDFSDPNSLRERQSSIINLLYSGIQCSSCGVRFSPEETVKYSRHLDWHFRQNRREKDAVRKGQSRKWYYEISDWIQFEEIEDLGERAQSWFETEATANGDDNNEQEVIKSVPAPAGHDFTLCELCRDEFDTYYNEEKEEWHLKPCILVEDKYYHPICYEDFVNTPEDSLPTDRTTDCSMFKDSTEENAKKDIKMDVKTEDVSEKFKTEEESDVIMSEESDSEVSFKLETENAVSEKLNENAEEVIRTLLDELINCIVFKNEIELGEDSEEDAEIEVLESVPAIQKKEIINVDLIEKLDDDDDDDIVYHRKTPSPIIIIPTSKIKQEPVDEMESPVAVVDQTITSVVSSIDGNVEKIDAPQVVPSAPSKIKITFNKPITSESSSEKAVKEVKEVPRSPSEESDPDPLPLRPKKPRIAEREMTVYLPCVRGTEMSGLCSIM